MSTPTTSRIIQRVNGYILNLINNFSAAYSLRKLKYNARYAIRVRRSSDNLELDIGFSGKSLDIVSLLTFCGTDSAYVKTWYDQSGNGNHATQITADSQPRIVNAGTLDTLNGKPSIYFVGSSKSTGFIVTDNRGLNIINSPLLFNAVFQIGATGSTGVLLSKANISLATAQYAYVYSGTAFFMKGFYASSVNYADTSIITQDVPYIYSHVWDGVNVKSSLNGTQSSDVDSYNTPLTTQPNITIGYVTTQGLYFVGKISEILIGYTTMNNKLEIDQKKYYGL